MTENSSREMFSSRVSHKFDKALILMIQNQTFVVDK